MQSKFENQIRSVLENSDQGSEFEPALGHEYRFERRLHELRELRKVKRIPRWSYIALAAAAVISLIISIVVIETKKTNDIAEKIRLSDVSGEMAAVEGYYHGRLQMNLNERNSTDLNIQRFMSDVKKLEDEYQMLEKTLAKNFRNERIALAMVNNYRYRLQLMEQLQKYIEIQNKINIQDHEEKLSS